LLVALVATICASGTAAFATHPAAGWTHLTPTTSPTARFEHAMAYDVANNVTVMFGGCAAFTTTTIRVTMVGGSTKDLSHKWCAPSDERNDTWVFDGSNWQQVIANGATGAPNARYAHSMAYDYASDHLILFGGMWQTDQTVTTPTDSDLCFADEAHGGIPAVSGVQDLGSGNALHYYCFYDTWSLAKTGSTWAWTRLTPTAHPTSRFNAGLAFDKAGHPTLVGGCHTVGLVGAHGAASTPTYWDCSEYAAFEVEYPNSCIWVLIDPSLCPPPTIGENIDSWRMTWSGTTPTWTTVGCTTPPRPPATPCAPSEMMGHTLTYDPGSATIVLYGGYYYDPNTSYNGYQAETWAYDSALDKWIRHENAGTHDQWCPSLSPATINTASAFAGIGNKWQVLTYGGFGKYFSTTPTCPTGQTDTQFGGPRPVNTQLWADTWRWDRSDCTVGTSAYQTMCWHFVGDGEPGALQAAASAYDQQNGKVVLFGGLDTAALSDTWTFAAPAPTASPNPCPSC
jgi:hypothetical protein